MEDGIIVIFVLLAYISCLLTLEEGRKLYAFFKDKQLVKLPKEEIVLDDDQPLVCPKCGKKEDLQLLSEQRRFWYCNKCKVHLIDKTGI
jgi:ssDNA-binding Zn-finger/Zn-ribbon topoisomerase 1